MSARNGDRSRFHRQRKQKIFRRKRTLELLKHLSASSKPGDPPTTTVPEAVAA
jgi:hypothetical protein